jgi:hypothetical protein
MQLLRVLMYYFLEEFNSSFEFFTSVDEKLKIGGGLRECHSICHASNNFRLRDRVKN